MSVDSTIRLIAETVRKQLKSDSLTTAYGAFARLMSVNSRPDHFQTNLFGVNRRRHISETKMVSGWQRGLRSTMARCPRHFQSQQYAPRPRLYDKNRSGTRSRGLAAETNILRTHYL
jgi:hypothetical protein